MTVSWAANVDVLAYDIRLEPNVAKQALTGKVSIQFRSSSLLSNVLQLSAGSLSIDTVHEHGRKLAWQKDVSTLSITLPPRRPALAADDTRTVVIAYRGTPTQGIRFVPNVQQVFTAFSTSEWLPCNDSPSDRATVTWSIVVPASHKVVANGQSLGERRINGGKKLSRWKQAQALPSYLFGFAAGEFLEVLDRSARPTLRYLVPQTFTVDQVRQIFRETRSMVAFYEGRAGVPYPAAAYTQVLVSAGAAQEVGGYAVMSESYGKRVLIDEKNIWLGAHELSHQWWGNAVTNWSWREFWLNEGIATFMNAAYFESRFGRAEYDRHINTARMKYDTIRADGKDASLVFPSWIAPTRRDRSLVYDKGAIVLHQLRELIGEVAFWAGLRHYTQRHWGRPVNTADFQRAMEAAAGQSLDTFFREWVYLTPR